MEEAPPHFSRGKDEGVRSSDLRPPSIMASAATKVHPELARQFPAFVAALNEFTLFLEAAEADLEGKRERLAEQRRLLSETKRRKSTRTKTTAKNYVDCQIFMLSRHARRLLLFRSETEARLAEVAKGLDATTGQEEAAATRQAVQQLHSDLAKMKRRCKHVLDVTDRYCVLTRTDLKLEEQEGNEAAAPAADGQSRPPSQNRSLGGQSGHSSSEDSVDGGSVDSSCDEAGSVASCPANVEGPLPVSPVARHMVRSTLESFGSHLRVIAKTYTKRRGRPAAAAAEEAAAPLPTVPEVEGKA